MSLEAGFRHGFQTLSVNMRWVGAGELCSLEACDPQLKEASSGTLTFTDSAL